MTAATTNATATDHLSALSRELTKWAPIWRPLPFHDDPPWVSNSPALANSLLTLTDTQVEALDNDPVKLQGWLAAQLPGLDALFSAANACIDNPTVPEPLAVAESVGCDVPGRKWQQILHFAAAIAAPTRACDTAVLHFVEWCSGKAHLSRLLLHLAQRDPGAAARRNPVALEISPGNRPTAHAIEWNAALCEDGKALATRDGAPITFHHADAIAISAADAGLVPEAHALALHACGDLHVALMHKAAAAGVTALDIAPCCYHLTQARHWQPLSSALAHSEITPLGLTRDDLRLAVQETVTSSPRVVRQQRELAAWRLGFDALQRNVRGVDAYLPTPSRPPSVLREGFAAFCLDMANHHHFSLPADADFDAFRRQGEARLARVRRLELPRHACRRALETLLVIDRAQFLRERGYTVAIQTFCPRALTPRNLLLRAQKSPTPPDGSTQKPA